jgi:hypothetical protein
MYIRFEIFFRRRKTNNYLYQFLKRIVTIFIKAKYFSTLDLDTVYVQRELHISSINLFSYQPIQENALGLNLTSKKRMDTTRHKPKTCPV